MPVRVDAGARGLDVTLRGRDRLWAMSRGIARPFARVAAARVVEAPRQPAERITAAPR